MLAKNLLKRIQKKNTDLSDDAGGAEGAPSKFDVDLDKTSIFEAVKPPVGSMTTLRTSINRCNSVNKNGKKYYVNVLDKKIQDLTIDQVLSLMTIYKNDEIKTAPNDVYTYVIGKKDGKYVLLSSLVKSSLELENKHMTIFMYGVKNNIFNEFNIYSAGEFILNDAEEADKKSITLNFLSGTYMLGYKRQWENILRGQNKYKRENIENYWFREIKTIFQNLTTIDNINYSNTDFINDGVIKFHPEFYDKLNAEYDIQTLFYTDKLSCELDRFIREINYDIDTNEKVDVTNKGSYLRLKYKKYFNIIKDENKYYATLKSTIREKIQKSLTLEEIKDM